MIFKYYWLIFTIFCFTCFDRNFVRHALSVVSIFIAFLLNILRFFLFNFCHIFTSFLFIQIINRNFLSDNRLFLFFILIFLFNFLLFNVLFLLLLFLLVIFTGDFWWIIFSFNNNRYGLNAWDFFINLFMLQLLLFLALFSWFLFLSFLLDSLIFYSLRFWNNL